MTKKENINSVTQSMSEETKGVAHFDRYGHSEETFLQLEADGRVTVKDGRSLEEYLNDPRLIERRRRIMEKHEKETPLPMTCMTVASFQRAMLTQYA